MNKAKYSKKINKRIKPLLMNNSKLHKKVFLLIFILLLVSPVVTSNYTPGKEASITIKPDSILIGEHVKMQINVETHPEAEVVFPVFTDTIHDNIYIINYGTIDTVYTKDSSRRILNQTHTITSYKEGHFPIKPIQFKSMIEEDTTVFESEPVLLSVNTVEVDLENSPKDIKPIINIPLTFAEILPYILAVLLLTAIIYFVIVFVKRRKNKTPQKTIWEKPGVPAHVAALNNLESLKKKNYLAEDKFKLFHSELTDIVRKYLAKRFGIDASEMTSDEILNATKNIIDEHENKLLQEIFTLSDLVKFAKYKPIINESEKLLKNAFELVNRTMKVNEETNKNNS